MIKKYIEQHLSKSARTLFLHAHHTIARDVTGNNCVRTRTNGERAALGRKRKSLNIFFDVITEHNYSLKINIKGNYFVWLNLRSFTSGCTVDELLLTKDD